MSQRVLRIADAPAPSPNLMFQCPGCDMFHGVHHGDGMWTWNGDVERPTIERSVLVCYYVISKEGYDMIERGEKPPAGQKYPGRAMVCHSYVRDGNIEFLGDCTHRLAGKTVPLPPVD